MKLDKMFQSLLLTSAAIVFIITPAQGEEVPEDVQGKSSVTPTKPTSHDTGKITDKGLAITQSSRFAPKSKKTQLSSSVTSVNSLGPTKKILQLSEIEHFSKSAELLVQSPTPTPTNPPNPEQTSGEQVVPITGVKANATTKGVEVILQTSKGEQLQVSNRSAGNNFIADISGAQLRLPSGEAFTFRSEKPLAGITEITVTNVDANTVRVTVVGEKALPTVELFDDNAGLVFGITSAATAMQSPQQPETPQAEEKPASETPQDKPLNSQQDEPIELVVTGDLDGYRVPNATVGTRTDTPLRDIPQSIQVIPQQVIQEQQANRLTEVLKNAPGVVQGDRTPRDPLNLFKIRGFTATGDILVNGIKDRSFSNLGFGSNIERVEVLKGPASVLFGQGGLGGSVNLVTKQPLRDPLYSVEASAGSYNFYRGAIDLSGPLNDSKTVLYRLNASAETTESFIDFYEQQQYLIAPALTFQIGDRTKLTLEADYSRADGPYDFGIPAEGSVLFNPNGKIPRNRFVSEPDFNDTSQSVFRVSYDFEHGFSDNWRVRSFFRASLFQLRRDLVAPTTWERGSLRNLNRVAEDFDYDENIYNLDNFVVGKFATGSIKHELVAGFNLLKIDTDITGISKSITPLDVFNPRYGATPTGNNPTSNTKNTIQQLGLYLQDQITLVENLKLLLGGRFDIANQKFENLLNSTDDFKQTEAFSPRVGIVYQPIQPISLYASYSRSFNQGVSTFSAAPPEPERGTQYEVGVKADLTDRLAATLAFYDLTRSNLPTADPNDPSSTRTIQIGEQRSRGIEFDISGEILPGWNIIAGYALTDTEVTRDNNTFVVGNQRLSFVGNELNNVPRHALNLWTTYEIQSGSLQGLGFGLGVFYYGERQANLENTVELPGYTRTDATVFYKRDNFRAAINIRNLFDVDYFVSAQNRNRIIPGDPLTVVGTISWQF
ncbi:TonB-dependent siderophore receptor [Tolypothrix campylonemoides VB511288]|nr:TonB-dependent siderophore receptor [Tolypothrix campylonemoides VB511288]